jgi:hypothetical protein
VGRRKRWGNITSQRTNNPKEALVSKEGNEH